MGAQALIEKYKIETIRHAANAIFNRASEAMSCQLTHPDQAREAMLEAARLADLIVASQNAGKEISPFPSDW